MSKIIDPQTNLPELPEGYRWRVDIYQEEYRSAPTLRVRMKKGIWTKVELEAVLDHLDPRDAEANRMYFDRHHPTIPYAVERYPEIIARLAEKVYEKRREILERDARYQLQQQAAKQLSGYYPPKRLPLEREQDA